MSLLDGLVVNLYELSGIDSERQALVLATMAHANGSHEHSGIAFDSDGKPTGFYKLDSLFPSPDTDATPSPA
ncbi:hypothetical protein ACFQB0_07755 [Luethyella okanaganae]|uniref:Uncharacterized protein n=1 Tax=Luethyella okanaganae TaxID=69372 RepID=A0ABW1VDY9_9MICO